MLEVLMNNPTKTKKQYVIESLAIVSVFVFFWLADILTKLLIEKNFDQGLIREGVIIDIFLTFNKGMAFGILLPPWLLMTISLLMSIGIVVFYVKTYRKSNIIVKILTMLILAGAFGNLVDRFFFVLGVPPYDRGVIHFIEPAFVDFAIFNLADSYLVVGLITIVIYFLVFEAIQAKTKNKKQIDDSLDQTNKLLTKEEIEKLNNDSLNIKDDSKK